MSRIRIGITYRVDIGLTRARVIYMHNHTSAQGG